MSKYKVGDKVKVKEDLNWIEEVYKAINKLSYIMTIKDMYVIHTKVYYYMEEIGWNWTENEIEGLASEVPETTRFELMEL